MRRLSLRWRVMLALVILAVGTSAAVSVATGYFLGQTPQISTNPAMREALEGGLTLAKREYDTRKAALTQVGAALAGSDQLVAAFRDSDVASIRGFVAQAGLDRVTIRFETTSGTKATKPALADGPSVDRSTQHPDALSLSVPVGLPGREPGRLIVEQPLGELLAIEEAVQTYGHIEMIIADLRSGLQLNLIAIAIVFTLLAATVGLRIGMGITGPLRELVRGTRELARDNLNYRIPPGPSDEIGILIDSFNTMARDLQENRRRRVEAEKLAAWQEIARRLAHEIKNPLTPIQLTVQQMRDKYPGDDEKYRRLLVDCSDIVTEEVESLRKLVQEFAEFARMPRLALTRRDINDAIRDTTRLYADSNIELDLAANLPSLHLDLEGIRRVIINMLENAMDAAGPGSPIVIRTHLRQGQVRLDFVDEGPGVAEKDREKIFQPYVSSKEKGMGLGLVTVQTIIEEHGGRITVSDSPRGGAQFEIALPVPQEPEKPAEA